MRLLFKKIYFILKKLASNQDQALFRPKYKLLNIIEEEDKRYTVSIKFIKNNIPFNIRPEEILSNDNMVDQFSPRDIRALTYLGYLGINSPKYKVLARKLTDNNQATFVLRKKGEKKGVVKTAKEIMNEAEIIKNMTPDDAITVGYTVASETHNEEKKQKELLLKQLKKQKNTSE